MTVEKNDFSPKPTGSREMLLKTRGHSLQLEERLDNKDRPIIFRVTGAGYGPTHDELLLIKTAIEEVLTKPEA